MGERRSIYLSRKDFNKYGYTDGCTGCRDIASGKQWAGSYISPHNAACRKRMEVAIKTADPDRWARYFLRRGQEGVAEEEEEAAGRASDPAVPPAAEDRAMRVMMRMAGAAYSMVSKVGEMTRPPRIVW